MRARVRSGGGGGTEKETNRGERERNSRVKGATAAQRNSSQGTDNILFRNIYFLSEQNQFLFCLKIQKKKMEGLTTQYIAFTIQTVSW